ncbi:MAG: hypothetical protein ACO1RX_18580 [Candidatus Sericytochromatia bacterium]
MPKLSAVSPIWQKIFFLSSRSLAFVLDLFVVGLIVFFLLSIYAWADLPRQRPLAFLLILAGFLPLCLAEARWGQTPGKWMNGLQLNVTGGFWLRMGKVLLRTLIKVSWWVALFFLMDSLRLQGLRLQSWYLFPVWAAVFYVLSVQLFKIPWFDAAYTWCGRMGFVNAQRPFERSLIQITMNGLLLYVGLTYFVWPQFTGPRGDSYPGNASVKANMHTLQTMVEVYNVEWGSFPHSLSALYLGAHKQNQPRGEYWKDFSNPYTGETGFGKAFQMDRLSPYKGIVTYAPEPAAKGIINRYWIYGYDKHARRILYRSSEFSLTNS